MARSRATIVTHEHPHTKMVKRVAENKKTDTLGLTIILGMLFGVFLCCLLIDPRSDSAKDIIIEIVKYIGGCTSAGAIIGLIVGEYLRREHVHLNVFYGDSQEIVRKQPANQQINEKETRQGTHWGEHTLGDRPLKNEYDELLMRR